MRFKKGGSNIIGSSQRFLIEQKRHLHSHLWKTQKKLHCLITSISQQFQHSRHFGSEKSCFIKKMCKFLSLAWISNFKSHSFRSHAFFIFRQLPTFSFSYDFEVWYARNKSKNVYKIRVELYSPFEFICFSFGLSFSCLSLTHSELIQLLFLSPFPLFFNVSVINFGNMYLRILLRQWNNNEKLSEW